MNYLSTNRELFRLESWSHAFWLCVGGVIDDWRWCDWRCGSLILLLLDLITPPPLVLIFLRCYERLTAHRYAYVCICVCRPRRPIVYIYVCMYIYTYICIYVCMCSEIYVIKFWFFGVLIIWFVSYDRFFGWVAVLQQKGGRASTVSTHATPTLHQPFPTTESERAPITCFNRQGIRNLV